MKAVIVVGILVFVDRARGGGFVSVGAIAFVQYVPMVRRTHHERTYRFTAALTNCSSPFKSFQPFSD
jgi:hypothetical protein